jgi:serine/threonine protein kinase
MLVDIGRKYCAKARIGGGSFGDIYAGVNLSTCGEVAIKVEPPRIRPAQLLNESRMYRALSGGVGIPNMRWYGIEGENSILVLDLLDRSLENLFLGCDRRFHSRPFV